MGSLQLRRARKHPRLGLSGVVVAAAAVALVLSSFSQSDTAEHRAAVSLAAPIAEPVYVADLSAAPTAAAVAGEWTAPAAANPFPEPPPVVLATPTAPVVAAPTVVEEPVPVDSARVAAVAAPPISPAPVPAAREPDPPPPTTPAPTPAKPNFYVPEPATGPITDLERRLLSGINTERTSAGLAPYELDPGLSRVARVRVRQMVDQNYFAHRDRFGYSMCTELLAYFGYTTYAWAGENLAMNTWGDAESPERAVADLMKSATHRANLLASDFARIGVGELTTADGRRFYAMIFLG